MKNYKCDNCKCSEHPEGIQTTIEILENLPEEILNDFKEKSLLFPFRSSSKIWKEIIKKRFY
jgi:hypothetical protein